MLCCWTIGSGLHKDKEIIDVLDLALIAGLFIGTIITVLQNVSGGDVNPAISIGLLVTRQISFVRFIFYVIAQISGGITAVILVKGLFPPDMCGTLGLISPGTDVTDAQAFGCEFFMAFLLLFGTVAMIDAGRSDIHGSIPLFVGFIVVVNVLFGVNIMFRLSVHTLLFSVLQKGHRQTVQTQNTSRKMWRLLRVRTICIIFTAFSTKNDVQIDKPGIPEMMLGVIKFIGTEESTRHQWLKCLFAGNFGKCV